MKFLFFFVLSLWLLVLTLPLFTAAGGYAAPASSYAEDESYLVDGRTEAELFAAAGHRRAQYARTLETVDCATTTCNEHGQCVSSRCLCFQDTAKGFWFGTNCEQCASGYAGINCVIECQGGSCNKCSGNGNCRDGISGDGTCVCYKDKVKGFWAGASCSQCASGYFGSKCQNYCPGVDTGTPCANRGECKSDAFGNGACSCNAGYGSASGCADCDDSHYGIGCSLTCPGTITAEGPKKGMPCSGNGRCLNGTANNGTCICQPFYGLEDCSRQCPNECSGHGWCSEGAQGTGRCTCDPRYAPPDCQFCIANRTGAECEIACPLNENDEPCSHHGICTYIHNDTAICNCSSGYTGEVCEIACPGEPPCSGHGVCTPILNGTGYTIGHECVCDANTKSGFWTGPACTTCLVTYNNSKNCNVACPVNDGLVCSGYGYCAEGFCYCSRYDPATLYDYCGDACEKSSQPHRTDAGSCLNCGCYYCVNQFTFGQTCQGTCPGTVGDITCSGHGHCSEGKVYPGECYCDHGYAGTACSLVCPKSPLNNLFCSGFYRGTCGCSDTSCSQAVCTCRDGFAGVACEIDCPRIAGKTCSGNGYCNSTGSCVCDVNYAGRACSVPCGCNTENGRCDEHACFEVASSETCYACNCRGNFTGVCNLCRAGTQGSNCTGSCINGVTSNTTKDCICYPNWSTPSCDVPCPVGSNGLICSGNGTCASGNRFSGACACNATLYGVTCETNCTVENCKQAGLVNAQCNSVTGLCECQNDLNGRFAGVHCDECVYGYWGALCNEECDCSGHGSCDGVSCKCSSDSTNGYFAGTTCSYCQSGYIGASCTTQAVAITRLSRTITGLSGYFLQQANATTPGLLPMSPVAAIDDYDNFNTLYVGGRPVAEFDVSGPQISFIKSTNVVPQQFTGEDCGSDASEVAYTFVDTHLVYHLLQPYHFGNCSLPIRLVIVDRDYQSTTMTLTEVYYFNSTTNGTHDLTFNTTVRVVAATSQVDTGDSQTAVKARLAFLMAEMTVDIVTGFLTPYPNGWLVHVALDELRLKQSRTVVSYRFNDSFVGQHLALSPVSDETFNVIAVAGQSSVTGWNVFALVVNDFAMIVPAYGSDASIKSLATCWEGDTGTCTFCESVQRVHWSGNDIIVAITTTSKFTDTVLVWFQRVQSATPGKLLYQNTGVPGECEYFTLVSDVQYGMMLVGNSTRYVPTCTSTNCPQAWFHVRYTLVGVSTSQATAIAFDSFSSVTYLALIVNSGNSASVLVKASISEDNFVVYGLLTLGYVTSSSGKSKPEQLTSLVISSKTRMMYAGVTGVSTLSIACFLLAEIQQISPDIADQRGGTKVALTGRGFALVKVAGKSAVSTYQPKCSFGGTYTDATVLSSTTATCYAPPESESASAQSCGLQQLEMTLHEERFFTDNQLYIQRAQSAKLTSVNPVRGFLTSATPQVINISGTGFQDSQFSVCKFFSSSSLSRQVLNSSVKLITPNLIQCEQPNATEPSYDKALLDVSIDGQLYTIDGPIEYQIVGAPSGLLNEPQVVELPAKPQTFFNISSFIVDVRQHKLMNLDAVNRVFYLLLNVSHTTDCSATEWRPPRNCIPDFELINDTYPNATSNSYYDAIPCHNASLNEVTDVYLPWNMSDPEGFKDPKKQHRYFPMKYSGAQLLTYQGVRVFALEVPMHVGVVQFDNLYLAAPRVGNITLTIVRPGTSWYATTTIVITPGQPFALIINNIRDFESYNAKKMASTNCSTSLSSSFFIAVNTPIAQLELGIADQMANVLDIGVNSYFVNALTYYIRDYDLVRVNGFEPVSPSQRGNLFVYSEITLPPINGAAHFVSFTATSTTNPDRKFSTTTPPIRTQTCGAGRYKVPLKSTCLACPEPGTECDGTEQVEVLPGYWRANGSTTHIYVCPGGADICLGSRGATNLTYCKHGHSGPLCATCIPNYGHSGQNCVECQSFAMSALVVVGVLLAVFIVVIVWTIVTLLNAETTDVSVIMRTVVNHMQATGELGQFSSQYGPFLQSFMSSQGQASGGGLSVNGAQAFDCVVRLAGLDYSAIFSAYMCLPILAVVLAIVVFGVVRALKLVPVITEELRKEIHEDIKYFGENAKTAIILERYPMFMVVVTTNCVIMFTLYQTLITQCATALQCNTYVYFENDDGTMAQQSYLAIDLSIQCSGSTSPLTTPALLFAACYGIGIPLAFTLGYMFVNDTVNMPQLTKLMFMFLCGGYKEQFFFWQCLIMIRKLILVLLIVFLKSDQELLNYCAMWIMSINLILQVWLQPAEKDEHNFIESVSLAIMVMTLNLGLLYFWTDLSSFGKDALTLTLIIITVGVLILFVYYIFHAVKGDVLLVVSTIQEIVDTLMVKVRGLFNRKSDKKRLKLNTLMTRDNDDPALPQLMLARNKMRGRRQGLGVEEEREKQDGNFDEVSSDEDSKGDDSSDEDEEMAFPPKRLASPSYQAPPLSINKGDVAVRGRPRLEDWSLASDDYFVGSNVGSKGAKPNGSPAAFPHFDDL